MYAKKNSGLKVTATLLAIVLLIGCTAGATLAWLMDKTGTVQNTFTTSNVDIDLTEETPTDKDNIKMVPGEEIVKDPKITVKANSEACYVFVKVEKSANFDTYMTYVMADGWTLVPDETNVYYRTHAATGTTDGTAISILKDDQVVVKDNVTNALMDAAKTANPTLTFTAYAIQQAGFATPKDAWAEAKTL